MNSDPVPIYNKDGDLIGIGYLVEGEEDRGIQVRRMFTHDRIESFKKEVELHNKLNLIAKEEAIMRIVRRIQ